MDIEEFRSLIAQIERIISRKCKRMEFAFTACIAMQLLHKNNNPEKYLHEICEKAGIITKEDINFDKRKELIDDLREFEEKLGLDRPVSLLCADTDRVKSYVFESAKLPEVRGGSIILDELNTELLKKEIFHSEDSILPEECLIYSSGGGAMVIVPAFLAENIRKKIERMYLYHTRVATITAVAKPFHLYEYRFGLNADTFDFDEFERIWNAAQPKRIMAQYYGLEDEDTDIEKLQKAFEKTKGFGELVRQMTYELQRAKRQKPFSPYIEAGKFLRVCDSCESRAAMYDEDTPEGETVYLCDICKQKRDKGREEKAKIVNENLIMPKYAEAYFKDLDPPIAVAPPMDLREIGRDSSSEAFIGMIYADGNNVGGTLERLRTPDEYQEFSTQMDMATREAVFETITERQIKLIEISEEDEKKERFSKSKDRIQVVYRKDNGTLATRSATGADRDLDLYVYNFELISAGGDDLVLFVPADMALWVACDICDRFSKKMSCYGISMSAGVIIASDHYPVYYLFNLASQLLKNAKRRFTDSPEGAIDFMVLSSQNTLSSQIKSYREEFLEKRVLIDRDKTIKEKLYLTSRPYCLSDIKKLLCWASKFKSENYPASQLYGVVQALNKHSRQHSTLRFLYQLQRHNDEDKRLLQDFICSWGMDSAYVPWAKIDSKMPFSEFSSVFVDMLEIYKFV